MSRPVSAVIAFAVLAVLAGAVPATADEQAEEHCVIEVVGQDADGRYRTAPLRCYDSRTDALRDARGSAKTGKSFTIGTHYDGANWTGSSITVTGSDCAGGYLNLTVSWRNRISSTLNGCSVVRHFNGLNMTGTSESTTGGGGNLTYLNNLTDSIQYTT